MLSVICDLYPTFMDIINQEYNPAIEGTIMPVLRNEIDEVYPFIVSYFKNSLG